MASLQRFFNDFLSNIRLEYQSAEYKAVKEKDESISPKIKKALENEGYKIITPLKLGSLAVGTAIKPLSGDYDLDKGFLLGRDSTDDDNPLKPKLIIEAVLKNHGFTNQKIKMPCVTADYASINMHIDYTVFRNNNWVDYHQLAVGKKHSTDPKWDDNDPIGLIDWINSDKNHQAFWSTLDKDEVKQYKRLVRYLKRWRDVKFCEADAEKVFSIALTVMAKECFKPSISDDGDMNDLKALTDTIEKMLSNGYFIPYSEGKHKIQVDLPVIPNRDIYDQKGSSIGTTFKARLETMRDKLIEAAETENLEKQTKILNKLFGDDFPVHSETKASNESLYKHLEPAFVQDHGGA